MKKCITLYKSYCYRAHRAAVQALCKLTLCSCLGILKNSWESFTFHKNSCLKFFTDFHTTQEFLSECEEFLKILKNA